MDYNYLSLEVKERLGIIKISRERALNALNREMLLELKNILQAINERKELRVIIITGKGKAFVAGADIAEMKDMDYEDAKKFAELGQGIFNEIEQLSIPVIAAINGYALGGGNELALACDIRIAGQSARFGQPETGLGIIPGFGGNQRLVRIVGEARAREILYTGNVFDSTRALEIGLVNRVVADDRLLDRAEEMAREIAARAPLALKGVKEAVNTGRKMTPARALERETELFADCFNTSDQKRGMEAYLDKRDVEFEGN